MPYKARWELDKDREELTRLKSQLATANEELGAMQYRAESAERSVKWHRERYAHDRKLIALIPKMLPYVKDAYPFIPPRVRNFTNMEDRTFDEDLLIEDMEAARNELTREELSMHRHERLNKAGLGRI